MDKGREEIPRQGKELRYTRKEPYAKCGGKNSSRLHSEKPKLSISLD